MNACLNEVFSFTCSSSEDQQEDKGAWSQSLIAWVETFLALCDPSIVFLCYFLSLPFSLSSSSSPLASQFQIPNLPPYKVTCLISIYFLLVTNPLICWTPELSLHPCMSVPPVCHSTPSCHNSTSDHFQSSICGSPSQLTSTLWFGHRTGHHLTPLTLAWHHLHNICKYVPLQNLHIYFLLLIICSFLCSSSCYPAPHTSISCHFNKPW